MTFRLVMPFTATGTLESDLIIYIHFICLGRIICIDPISTYYRIDRKMLCFTSYGITADRLPDKLRFLLRIINMINLEDFALHTNVAECNIDASIRLELPTVFIKDRYVKCFDAGNLFFFLQGFLDGRFHRFPGYRFYR